MSQCSAAAVPAPLVAPARIATWAWWGSSGRIRAPTSVRWLLTSTMRSSKLGLSSDVDRVRTTACGVGAVISLGDEDVPTAPGVLIHLSAEAAWPLWSGGCSTGLFGAANCDAASPEPDRSGYTQTPGLLTAAPGPTITSHSGTDFFVGVPSDQACRRTGSNRCPGSETCGA